VKAILNRTELIKSLKKLSKYSDQLTSDYPEKHLVRIDFDMTKYPDGLELACADGEFVVTQVVKAPVVMIDEPYVVPIILLRKILESMQGEEQVILISDLERRTLEIMAVSGSVVFSITIYDADNFLFYHQLEDFSVVSGPVVVKGLASTLRPVMFAASKDPARPVLNSVYFDGFIATTDGFMVSKISQGIENLSGLMSIQALRAISSLFGDAEISITQTNYGVLVTCGHEKLMFDSLEGNFPQVNAIIPKTVDCWFMINKKALVESLKPAGVIRKISDYSGATRMEFKDEHSLEVTATAESVGRAVTQVRPSACVRVDGFTLPFLVAVNERMLIECVSHIPGENIRIGFNKNNTPIVIRPDENPESLVMLLMPMHLG